MVDQTKKTWPQTVQYACLNDMVIAIEYSLIPQTFFYQHWLFRWSRDRAFPLPGSSRVQFPVDSNQIFFKTLVVEAPLSSAEHKKGLFNAKSGDRRDIIWLWMCLQCDFSVRQWLSYPLLQAVTILIWHEMYGKVL